MMTTPPILLVSQFGQLDSFVKLSTLGGPCMVSRSIPGIRQEIRSDILGQRQFRLGKLSCCYISQKLCQRDILTPNVQRKNHVSLINVPTRSGKETLALKHCAYTYQRRSKQIWCTIFVIANQQLRIKLQ